MRGGHTAIWTGNEMIVWGGFNGTNFLTTGGKYNPVSGGWTLTNTSSAPKDGPAHRGLEW